MTRTDSASFRTFVAEALTQNPDTPTAELLTLARGQGYRGGKTAFYALVARMRGLGARRAEVEPRAGEICEHDVGEAIVSFDGVRRRVYFLASRLAYSRWLTVSLMSEETPEAVARAMLEAYAALGGLPMLARFARARVVALPSQPRPEWSLGFAYFAAELGIGLEICERASRAQAALSRSVRDGFFRDPDLARGEDLELRLEAWLEQLNVRTPIPGRDVTAATLFAEERRRLRPLPVTAGELLFRRVATVAPGGAVIDGKNVYNVPASAAGSVATLMLAPHEVHVIAGEFAVTHPRAR
jgi:hypothetical protein